ncbi:MAG: CxxC-x17-CxxC domain-containing protein [Minisyncoccales bacterium]
MKNFNNIFENEKRNGARESDFKRMKPERREFSNDRDRERPQMHEAVCSDCGKRCEVPFRPTGDKPVYCSQCFTSHGGASSSDRSDRRGGRERPRFQDKRMFDATCATCGKRFELPFRPTGEKPVYCNECFDRGGNAPTTVKSNVSNEQFEMLNAKLDRIIKVLIPVVAVKEEKKPVVVEKKEIVIEKKEKAKKSKVAAKKVVVKKKKAKK